MNILILIQDFCYRLFYGNSIHKTKTTPYYPAQEKVIPPKIIAKMNFQHETSFDATSFGSRTFAPSAPIDCPTIRPLARYSHPTAFKNDGLVQKSSRIQPQANLSQSLQNQVNELENEKKAILEEIAIKRSEQTPFKTVYSSSHLICNENEKKHVELSKLNSRLENISDFCNQEMIDVLCLITESSMTLDKKLAKLRQEAVFIEDDALLCENIERITILENAIEALHQLEAKFQKMQKAGASTNSSSQTKQEAYISSLFDKIDKINKQKQFLNECKQSLPAYGAYDAEELQVLLQLFENDDEELSQKTKESKHKVNHAEQFAHEMTNHLLDYAEIFKDYFQKLQNQKRVVKQTAPTPIQPTITRLNPTHASVATVRAQIQSTEEDKFDSNPMKAAALEVAKALKDLMQIDSSEGQG